MQILHEILSRNGLAEPDARALHGYEITPDEHRRLEMLVQQRIRSGGLAAGAAQAFVLWAAEHIRTRFAGGILSWEFVFGGLGAAQPAYENLQRLVSAGLGAWKRPLRKGNAGHREFLYSLLAEGGLPDLAVAQAPRYRAVLFRLIAEIEAEGAMAAAMAEAAALRAVGDLPQVFRTGEQARLLAELAQAIVAARAALPQDLPEGSAECWLDAHRPGWRQTLPLRLSPVALNALIRPALEGARQQSPRTGQLVTRQLRRRADGAGWIGVAEIADAGLLPATLLPGVDAGLRLRLTADAAESSASFLGVPTDSGWDLMRSAGRGAVTLPLSPDESVILAAHADGRALAEVVLDAGLPAPDEAPGLWRPADAQAAQPEALLPLSGRARTRAAQLFVLAGAGTPLEPGPGLVLGRPEAGPKGLVWPVSGRGLLRVGAHRIAVETGAEDDAPPVRLALLGKRLPGLSVAAGTPVHLGQPQILGAEGEGPLRYLEAAARLRPLPRLLGGRIVEWVENDLVLARTRLVILPADLRLDLRDRGGGLLRLDAQGLEPGWHLHLRAAGVVAQGLAGPDGRMTLDLRCAGQFGLVEIRIAEPDSGAVLELAGGCPTRGCLILDPSGRNLGTNRPLSRARLGGWRGLLPEAGGAVQLRQVSGGTRVAFPGGGMVRLSAYAGVIDQALAFEGADGRVNLRLVAGGMESCRLEIGRYDWCSDEAGPFRHLGTGRTRLHAVCLDDPARQATAEAEGRIDLAGWLGEERGLWFVQGVSDRQGVMRPFVWSARPQPNGSRDHRVQGYADDWTRLLDNPDDPGWSTAWELIAAVRGGGDAAALDQVQALARIPAAAVALVLVVPRADRAAALALETETPLWWPLVPCADWARAMDVARRRLVLRLAAIGSPEAETRRLATTALQRVAGEILTLRPELAAHLGQALAAAGEAPLALDGAGAPVPLAVAPTRLRRLAQEAARRFDRLPDGVGRVEARALRPDFGLPDHMAPLLHAPFVVAEIAAGLRGGLTSGDNLQLIALRAADPAWFDAALPAALMMAKERHP